MENSDLEELNQKFLREFYDKETNTIVQKYTILVENDDRYVQIPDDMMDEKYFLCNKRYQELSVLIKNKYPDKYIHISQYFLTMDNIKDMSGESASWGSSAIYYNPQGIWLSCGSAWLDWFEGYCNQWLKLPYVYEIDINKNTVLKINNIFQFRDFAKKYRNPDATSLEKMIDWSLVKEDYDGLIICPYLGSKIWKVSNPTTFGINKNTIDYIETALDTKVFEVDAFIYEWYRHWETATGVIWRPSGIKSITLIDENHWYEEFLNKLRETLMDGKKWQPSPIASRIATKKKSGIKILTYNVSWQSTSGKQSGWALCNNAIDETNDRHFTKCIQNMVKFIDDNGPYDFVCLQEITNLDIFIKESTVLPKMSYDAHKSGPEEIVTFWDAKYHLSETKNGEFKPGRPYQILIFQEKICLINIHLPHTNKFRIKQNLGLMFDDLDTQLEGYRFIIAGDFNYAINHGDKRIGFLPKLHIHNTSFYIDPSYILTCCVPPFEKLKLQFDHVIDSFAMPGSINSPSMGYPASDHLPIIAILARKKEIPDANMGRVYHYKYKKYKKKFLKMVNK